MTAGKRWAFLINLVGGIAVLVSYAYGLATHPELRDEVWGGVPHPLRGFYTVSMLSAAVGYFLFGFFVLFRVDAATARVGRWAGAGTPRASIFVAGWVNSGGWPRRKYTNPVLAIQERITRGRW